MLSDKDINSQIIFGFCYICTDAGLVDPEHYLDFQILRHHKIKIINFKSLIDV